MNASGTSALQVDIAPHPEIAGVLRARVQGEETFDNTVAYWRRIVQAVAENGTLQKLLVMDELRGDPLGEAQWLELVLDMRDQRLDALRIAHVRVWGLREIEYCELYARDAGLDARVFADEASATEWLRQV